MEVTSRADVGPVIRLNLPIHATIITMQNENGLRHRDHTRYRKYLSRRLQKVRRATGLTCGKGRTFVKKEITVDLMKSREHLLVMLLGAERSWSYSVELKEASALDGQHKLKHMAVARLSKAVKHSALLRDICLETADPQTALEATAYADWMNGHFLIEKENWAEALFRLSNAKAIYQELSSVGSLHDQDLFQTRLQELDPPIRFCRFNTGSDSEPMDMDTFSSAPDIRAKFDEIRAKRSVSETNIDEFADFTVKFAGRAIPVLDDDLKTRCTIVKASIDRLVTSKILNSSEKFKEKEFSIALGQIEDALGAVSKLSVAVASSSSSGGASRLTVSSAAGKVGEMKASLSLLKNYFVYQRLQLLFAKNKDVCCNLLEDAPRIIGNQLHCDQDSVRSEKEAASSQRVHELAHLLDQRLGLIKEMLSVPGIEGYDLLKLQLSAEEYICRTLRVCFIAECYAVDRMWAEATALVDHAEELSVTARDKFQNFNAALNSTTDASDTEEFPVFSGYRDSLIPVVESLEDFVAGTRARQVAVHALQTNTQASPQLKTSSDDGNDMDEKEDDDVGDRIWSMMNRPDQWIEPIDVNAYGKNRNIIASGVKRIIAVDEIPSGFNAIPCKPVFFDIASNYIEFPDLDERAGIGKRKQKGEEAAGGIVGVAQGLFGWFSSK